VLGWRGGYAPAAQAGYSLRRPDRGSIWLALVRALVKARSGRSWLSTEVQGKANTCGLLAADCKTIICRKYQTVEPQVYLWAVVIRNSDMRKRFASRISATVQTIANQTGTVDAQKR
jgi:hypothetical protein